MVEEELQVVRRCLDGEQEAFEALYAAHAGRVKVYLLRSGFESADAEDLMQEVFFRAFRSLRTFDPIRGTLRSWLGAIARNVVRKRWSRRNARLGELFQADLADEMFAAPGNPSETSETREEIDAVRQCVEGLPADLKRIMRLRYVDGRTTRGIAAAVGMPESTLRVRLGEAREAVARCLRAKGILP